MSEYHKCYQCGNDRGFIHVIHLYDDEIEYLCIDCDFKDKTKSGYYPMKGFNQ